MVPAGAGEGRTFFGRRRGSTRSGGAIVMTDPMLLRVEEVARALERSGLRHRRLASIDIKWVGVVRRIKTSRASYTV